MSDTDDKKETREQKHEEREEAREKRHEAHEEARKERHAHHHHGDHLGHRIDRDEARAHDELEKISKEVSDVTEKKELHVHTTHRWVFRLHHAAMKLLRTHEDELDEAKPEAAWIPDALDAIFDADKQAVALHKAVVDASGKHTAKDADFDKANIPDLLKAFQADIDKAAKAVPAEE